jgi:hypothetical protein
VSGGCVVCGVWVSGVCRVCGEGRGAGVVVFKGWYGWRLGWEWALRAGECWAFSGG